MEAVVDHYAVLGLPSGEEGAKLTEKEISKAYKTKALELHPDKRPDDPNAHDNFQKLKSSYEILKDEKARKLFDDLLRVKRERERRQYQSDSKRRKMVSDLEERERASFAPDFATEARDEEERIARKLKEEIARIRAMHASKKSPASSAPPKKETPGVGKEGGGGLEKEKVLKVSWEKGGLDYTAEMLRNIFSKFGKVEDVVIKGSKKKCSALVVMSSKDAVTAATESVCGDLSNPLLVLPLQPTVPFVQDFPSVQKPVESVSMSKLVGPGYQAYEDSVLEKLQKDKHAKEITLKAMGQAINKAVAVVEFLKKQFPTLHQDTAVSSVSLTDVWERIEGLLPVETTRQVSMISITLSTNDGVRAEFPLQFGKQYAAMETPERMNFQRLSISSPSTPQSTSASRLWRPYAQRNLRNQWSKLAACRQQWTAASSSGRSEATSLVNAYLSQIYMPTMKLGALSDFPCIRENALRKLIKQQELQRSALVITYRVLVSIVLEMINVRRKMRCKFQGADNSPIAQFSCSSDVSDDTGDGDEVPVYRHWSISQFVLLAGEFIQMFKCELNMKRRLMVELLSLRSKRELVANSVSWSDELYPGEFEDLSRCNIILTETEEAPMSNCQSSNHKSAKVDAESASKVLEVYLAAWISEVNLDLDRLDEILNLVGFEMQVTIK